MWEEEEDEQELCALLEQCGRWKSMQRASGDWNMYVLFLFFFLFSSAIQLFFFFIYLGSANGGVEECGCFGWIWVGQGSSGVGSGFCAPGM